jgi:hypothetical protein
LFLGQQFAAKIPTPVAPYSCWLGGAAQGDVEGPSRRGLLTVGHSNVGGSAAPP